MTLKDKYTITLDQQEMVDVLNGLETIKERAANEKAEQRFQKLWEKITDIFEGRI
jgi:chaperonin cofactor prefoldin